MMLSRKWSLALLAAVAIAAAGCSSGGKNTAQKPPLPVVKWSAVKLPAGNHGLTATGDDPIMVAAGKTERRGNVDIACPADGEDCSVAFKDGEATYKETGGKPTVTAALDDVELGDKIYADKIYAKTGLTTAEASTSIDAGGNKRIGNVEFSCPSGESALACVVKAGDDSAKYEATGGTPEAAPAYDDLMLPKGHDLATIKLDGGESHYGERGVGLVCPGGENAQPCDVMIASPATYNATGGTPIVKTNPMVLAANVGLKGDSDGSHAVGLVTRIGTTNAIGLGVRHAEFAGSIVQSTMEKNAAVTDSSTWAAKDPAPTLSVTLGRDAFGNLPSLPDPIAVRKQSKYQDIPTLEGFEEAALRSWKPGEAPEAFKRHEVPGGTTVYAAVYSDIEKATAGVPAKTMEWSKDFSEDASVQSALAAQSARVVSLALPVDVGLTVSLKNNPQRDWDETVAEDEKFRVQLNFNWNTRTVDGYDHDDDTGTPPILEGDLTCVEGPCRSEQHGDAGPKLVGKWKLVIETDAAVPEMLDAEYLTFGAWLSVPDEDDGRFDLGVFASGKKAATNYPGLGKATYKGPATGIYARGEYRQASASQQGRAGTPAVESARVGAFAAEATLEADFGNDGDAQTFVSGHIRKFEENGASLGDWSVELGRTADDDPDGLGIGDAPFYFGATVGEADGRRLMGQWGVQFFKDGNEKAPDDDGFKAGDDQPGYAAGTFSASTQDEDTPQKLDALHIVGAFGAKKQQ
jgi:hypothetical protein